MDVQINTNPLSTSEQLLVVVASTLVGFFASKGTENGLTKFLVRRKATN